MNREKQFFEKVARRKQVRPSVRAIVIRNDKLLVEQHVDTRDGMCAFPGGEYEIGDTFEERLHIEFREETTANVVECRYLFVVENRFQAYGKLIHSLEHYFAVAIDRDEVESREDFLTVRWLPVADLRRYDVRPKVVKDLIIADRLNDVQHLIVPYPEEQHPGLS